CPKELWRSVCEKEASLPATTRPPSTRPRSPCRGMLRRPFLGQPPTLGRFAARAALPRESQRRKPPPNAEIGRCGDCFGIPLGYTAGMKIAISIPDPLFKEAEAA